MYEFKWVRGHVEVFFNGEFQFSADNMKEAHDELATYETAGKIVGLFRELIDQQPTQLKIDIDSAKKLSDVWDEYGPVRNIDEVPQDVIKWLFSLPGDGTTADDIYQPVIDEQDFVSILNV